MNKLEMFESFDDKEQDTDLAADQNFFIKKPDLSKDQPFDKLRESGENLHSTFRSKPFFRCVPQDPHSLLSSSHEYFDHSYAVFNDINIGNGRMSFAPLPDPTVLHPLNASYESTDLDLAFEPTLPFSSRIPVSAASSAIPFDNTPRAQTISAPISVSDGTFMWSPMNTENLPQTSGADFQQHFPMVASLPDQLSPSQTNVMQIQYMQAMRQLQFAENQPYMNTQLPYQSSVNTQLPQNAQSSPNLHSTQNSQQLQVSTHLPNFSETPNFLPDMESNLVESAQSIHDDSTRRTVISIPLSMSTESSSIVTSVAVSSSTKQQVQFKYPPQPHENFIYHTVQSVQDKPRPHARPTSWGQLAFTSLYDAQAAMPTRYIEQEWQGPSSDETIPYTDADRAYWVAKMLNAMVDTSKCKDNKAGFSFLKRWEKHDYYNIREMEKVCWHMLDVAERLHAHGPSATNIYCQDALRKLYASRGLTFEQRIVAICDMLALSKFLCDNLMKGEGIEALVGAPKQKMSGAKTMMVQNRKRQNWLETGRRTDAGRTYNEDDEHEFTVNMANIQEPSRRKAKRKRSAPANAHRVVVRECSHRVSFDSDNSEESFGLSFHQPVCENRPEDQSDDDAIHESDHIISATFSPASQMPPGTRARTSMDISSASPTSVPPLTMPLPSTYTMPSISVPPSPSPSPPKHYPPTRSLGGTLSYASESFPPANRRVVIHHEAAKQRINKRDAVSCFKTFAKASTKNPSGKLTIDFTASDSNFKDSSLSHKRSRKSSSIVGAHKVSPVPSYHSDSDGFAFLQSGAELTTDEEQDNFVRRILAEDGEQALDSDGEIESIIPKHRCLVMDRPCAIPANPSDPKDSEASKLYKGNEVPGSASKKRAETSYSSLRRKRAAARRIQMVD